MRSEDGFVLPICMVLIALISTLFLFATEEWSKWKLQNQIRLAMVQAGYASESAIAIRQAELKTNPDDYRTVQKQIGNFTVDTTIWESFAGTLYMESVAKDKNGIKQTKTVELEKNTLRILYWLE
ncbi:hypothetical protein [Shimazuella kribbensis]|uniref:hypothetical protein n=1 Tax=Shimazuella kribbensis TaxID=139808 RepID=UPI000424D328|nr:hypothetical protein [Shimazuella kribbensis]